MVEIVSRGDGPRPQDARLKAFLDRNRATITKLADHLTQGGYSAGKRAQATPQRVEDKTIVHVLGGARQRRDRVSAGCPRHAQWPRGRRGRQFGAAASPSRGDSTARRRDRLSPRLRGERVFRSASRSPSCGARRSRPRHAGGGRGRGRAGPGARHAPRCGMIAPKPGGKKIRGRQRQTKPRGELTVGFPRRPHPSTASGARPGEGAWRSQPEVEHAL